MKTLIVLATTLFSLAASASSLSPIPGTCRAPSRDGHSHCEAVSDADGRWHRATFETRILSCEHYRADSKPAGCDAASARTETCTFQHANFGGSFCVENLDNEASCNEILNCLNDSLCIKNYCSATTIRGGWFRVR
jgi:hypothetical protein